MQYLALQSGALTSFPLHGKKNKKTTPPKKPPKPQPWLVWTSGLSASLWAKRSPVRLPVRAYAWVVDQVPSWGCARGNRLFFLHFDVSLPFLLPPFPLLKISKIFKKKMPAANTIAAQCEWIKLIHIFCQIGKKYIFAVLQNFSNYFVCAMRWKRLRIIGLEHCPHLPRLCPC